MSLQTKTVVITGAYGRLGQVLVRAFQHEGATVVAVARSVPDLEIAPTFTADVTNEDDVQTCFEAISRTYGSIDVVVHTVGMWAGQPFTETRLADWQKVLRINLDSAFVVFREALVRMDASYGRLLAIASAQGADRAVAQQAAYSASKAGVVRLVEAIGAEYSGTGISAHTVAPSLVLYDDTGDKKGVPAEHLAQICIHLCSEVGPSVNGTVIRAYGNR